MYWRNVSLDGEAERRESIRSFTLKCVELYVPLDLIERKLGEMIKAYQDSRCFYNADYARLKDLAFL